jgi:hypothetical protein
MQLNRKQDLSIYYWLIDTVPSGITVEDGFPTGKLDLPTVSIVSLDTKATPFELGGCDLDEMFWRIDCFAVNKAQRDELAYLIYKELEQGIPVYDYDLGFVTPPQIGTLVVSKRNLKQINLKQIHVFENLVEKLYWRSGITYFTYYEPA